MSITLANAQPNARARVDNTIVEAHLRTKSQKNGKSQFLIDPRTSKFVPRWDMATFVALFFTALVTPYEVSFLSQPETMADPLFVINRLVDTLFLIDMVISAPRTAPPYSVSRYSI